MKASEFRDLVESELDSRINDLRNTLFRLRLNLRTGQLEKSASVRMTRRDLARALTVQAERRRGS